MRLYGLIGYPLGHSFSKKYFTEKFEKENLGDCFFELFPLSDISQFSSLIEKQKQLCGLAVTIPHKQAVIPFLQELHMSAQEVGAVNCIKISKGKLTGFNTDAIGFEKSFLPLLNVQHKQALVLGSGGASKAVQYVLKKFNIPFLCVSRSTTKGSGCIGYEELTEGLIQANKIIINCTPVGMTPNESGLPQLPYSLLTEKHLLYDLVYKPAETRFLAEGKKMGCTIKNGYEMLLLQAEENWRIWNED